MNLKLNGLAAELTGFVETKAAARLQRHYCTNQKIAITKSGDAEVDNWKISKDDVVNVDDKIIDIENSTGTILPGTGGMGTILFTVVGIALCTYHCSKLCNQQKKMCLISDYFDGWMRGLPSGRSSHSFYNSRENGTSMRKKNAQKKKNFILEIFSVELALLLHSPYCYIRQSVIIYMKKTAPE